MKLLSISGGATKISGLAGAADELINKKGYAPDLIVGTSAGAILGLPIALGYFDIIKTETSKFKMSDIFSKAPMNSKGKITLSAILRIVTGKVSLGVQDKLVITLSRIITPLDFEIYLSDDKYPPVYVGCVDFKTGSRVYINLKDCIYEEYLIYTLASTSIPYMSEPVHYDGKILFDGGVRDHIGSHWMMKNIDGITENVSIFSRPKDMKSILDTNWDPDNLMDIFERDQSIRVLELSKKDEELEELWAEKNKIDHTGIFLPSVMKSLYDTNPERIKKLYKEGVKATLKYYLK